MTLRTSALLLLLSLTHCKLRHYDWSVLRNIQVIADRSLIVQTVNGDAHQTPLHVENGDVLSINVTNNLPDMGVSFHWHGFEMRGDQVYDGVVGVTQCAIAPGESFLYIWTVRENPGTYWWHTHAGIPLVGHDFARGPLIVHPEGSGRADLENYEEETNERVIFYEDLYPTWLYKDYLLGLGGLTSNPLKDLEGFYESPVGWTAGIANGEENLQITVRAGETYRFRLLNGGHVFPYVWSVDGLEFTVVAADGAATQPYKTDGVQIHIGERFDVDITFPELEENTSLYMRAVTPARVMTNGIHSRIHIIGTKSTRSHKCPLPSTTDYKIPRKVLNCVLHPEFKKLMNCRSITDLKPAELLQVPQTDNSDLQYVMVDFDDERAPLSSHFVSINNGIFKQTVLPYRAIIRGDFNSKKDLHPNASILKLPLNKTIIMIFRSATAFPHPLHIHGHKFEVLEIAPRKSATCAGSRCEWRGLAESFSQPLHDLARSTSKSVLKDIAIIPAGGLVALRFRSDNPGGWAIHCHLDQHLEDGQILVMDEGEYRMPVQDFPKDYPSCDYKGRLQMRPRPACVCMQHLRLYKPGNWKTYYQCSEPHLCGSTKFSDKDLVTIERLRREYNDEFDEQSRIRIRPEEGIPFDDIEQCIRWRMRNYDRDITLNTGF